MTEGTNRAAPPGIRGPSYPGVVRVLVTEELLRQWLTRDADGNRLSMELGEPDENNDYTPVITVHYDDNPMRALNDEFWHAIQGEVESGEVPECYDPACENPDVECTAHELHRIYDRESKLRNRR